ncbi:prepilin-type N-terminal cleavage/methylation domain-containing protein [Muricoccus pecuniae]|uniref:General secretion pathway protein J n=1 Tax=Muricoccus pecuniae TaxID=693023 RepID=A0A840Y0F0_9PROT|nr:prepilin-type N-terminal cleavage/methylation domain-containing protein [Roseomonas pecuniae]MBB5693060.1 general secretion pathway protein J [Roseomonas pecuniae]
MTSRPGMTLVETLVGLVVLGLVAALGLSALGIVGRAGAAVVADHSAVAAAQDLLRLRLLGAMPLVGPGPAGRPAVLFEGGAERLAFVTELPARFGLGGPALVELRRDEEGVRLFWRGLGEVGSGEGAAGRLLLGGVAGLRLRYFGAPRASEEAAWREVWSDAARLPLAVEIGLAFPAEDARRWPPLVVAPRLAGLREERVE